MYIVLYLMLAGWSVMMFFSYRYVSRILKKYRNIERISMPAEYDCFKKEDLGKWNQSAIWKGFFLNFPINLVSLAVFMLTFALLCLLNKHFGLSSKYVDAFRRRGGKWLIKWRTNVIEEFNADEEIDTSIVISNHICWFDMAYMASCFRPLSFVAKHQIESMPIIGLICNFLGCIFVDRSSQEDKNLSRGKIKKRIQQFQVNPKETFPIAVYPEGAVSNGRSLLSFKKGAFQHLSSVTVLALRYQCPDFHMGYNEMLELQHFIISLCIKITLRVRRTKLSPQHKESPQEYMMRCQKKLAQMGGFRIFNCGYSDSLNHYKLSRQMAKAHKAKMGR